MGKGSSSDAPSPDPQIGQAALQQAATGQGWLDAAKQQFAIENARQDKQDELTDQVTQSQLTAQNNANDWAQQDRDRYESVEVPLQDQFIDQAKNWGSTANQDAQAAAAKADVLSNAKQAQGTWQRQMAAEGVNPASGRYAGTERAGDLATGLAAAGAENTARSTVRTQGMALLGDAVNVGSGLASQAGSSLGLGVNAGTAAENAAATNANSARSNFSTLASGYGGAMSGYGGEAGTLNSLYNNQLSGWQAQTSQNNAETSGIFGAIGQLGTAAILSTKTVKTEGKSVRGVLDAVKSMPVEKWQYKDGMGDGGGQDHVGPYAEDFRQATGLGDGRTIPVVDAIGVTMGAVKELGEKVDKLAAAMPKTARGVMRAAA